MSISRTTDLLTAWQRWDTHCTKVHADHHNHNKEPMGCPTTIAMEEACQAYAESMGVACGVMRARFAELRRSGMTREEVIDSWRQT